MTNQNGYTGGGSEYAAPRPSMRQAPGAPTYDAGNVAWGQSAPSAPVPHSPAAAAAAAALAGLGDDNVTLSRAYKAHDEDVQRIRFRRPTGRDVAQCGYPFRVVQSAGVPDGIEYKVVPESVSKLIVALSEPPLPRSTVDTFDIRDWNACSSRINGFFLE